MLQETEGCFKLSSVPCCPFEFTFGGNIGVFDLLVSCSLSSLRSIYLFLDFIEFCLYLIRTLALWNGDPEANTLGLFTELFIENSELVCVFL